MDDAYRLIRAIPKNARERIQIGMTEYNGNPFLDLRTFYLPDGCDAADDGAWRPGRQGIGVRYTLLSEVIEALTDALDLARDRGLVQ